MWLILMRHGATRGNEQRRYIGCRIDEPLSEVGRAQCAQAGVFTQVEKVYVSPMLRARQTAQLCFPQAHLQAVPGLQEIDFGSFEGKSAQDMEHDEEYRAWVDSGCQSTCPGGESHDGYVARSNAALESLLRKAAQNGEQQVIVVAHGGTIMAALSAFAQGSDDNEGGLPSDIANYFRWHVRNCEGYCASVRFDEARLTLADPQHFLLIPL